MSLAGYKPSLILDPLRRVCEVLPALYSDIAVRIAGKKAAHGLNPAVFLKDIFR